MDVRTRTRTKGHFLGDYWEGVLRSRFSTYNGALKYKRRIERNVALLACLRLIGGKLFDFQAPGTYLATMVTRRLVVEGFSFFLALLQATFLFVIMSTEMACNLLRRLPLPLDLPSPGGREAYEAERQLYHHSYFLHTTYLSRAKPGAQPCLV